MQCKIIRNNNEITSTEIESLKRFKDDVTEVLEGFECGVVLKENIKLEVGDILIPYKVIEIKRIIKCPGNKRISSLLQSEISALLLKK